MFKALSPHGVDWSMTAEHAATLAMGILIMAFWLRGKAESLGDHDDQWRNTRTSVAKPSASNLARGLRISWRNQVPRYLSMRRNSRPFSYACGIARILSSALRVRLAIAELMFRRRAWYGHSCRGCVPECLLPLRRKDLTIKPRGQTPENTCQTS